MFHIAVSGDEQCDNLKERLLKPQQLIPAHGRTWSDGSMLLLMQSQLDSKRTISKSVDVSQYTTLSFYQPFLNRKWILQELDNLSSSWQRMTPILRRKRETEKCRSVY